MEKTNTEHNNEIISDDLAYDIISTPKTILIKDLKADYKPSKNNSFLTKTIPVQCEKYQCEIRIRQTVDNPLNFSVILIFDGNHVIVRYNGNHGTHKNRIEKSIINGPHVHRITERYQANTHHPDGYAEPTGEYKDLNGALETFMKDMNIKVIASKNTGGLDDYVSDRCDRKIVQRFMHA